MEDADPTENPLCRKPRHVNIKMPYLSFCEPCGSPRGFVNELSPLEHESAMPRINAGPPGGWLPCGSPTEFL